MLSGRLPLIKSVGDTVPSVVCYTFCMSLFKKFAVISAVYGGFSYIAGMFVYLVILGNDSAETTAEQVAFMSQNTVLMHITTLHIYVLFSAGIVTIASYVYLKLQSSQSVLALLSLISGVIWSTLLIASGFISMMFTSALMSEGVTENLIAAWPAVDIVRDALGGGNELLGGVFAGLLSLTLFKARLSSVATNTLGVIVFAGGVISALPHLADVGIGIFVMSQIVWFFCLAWDIRKN